MRKRVKRIEKNSMKLDVVDIKGAKSGSVEVADEIFNAKVSEELMARALRAYLDNQHQGTSQAKTRAEVIRTTAKVYRQKGTGNARHGSKRAPIFVGGGVAHGPRINKKRTELTKKVKRAALFGSLTDRLKKKTLWVVTGLEKIEPKTKAAAKILVSVTDRKKGEKVLVIMPEMVKEVWLSHRNMSEVVVTSVKRLNALEIMQSSKVVIMKESLGVLENALLGKSKSARNQATSKSKKMGN